MKYNFILFFISGFTVSFAWNYQSQGNWSGVCNSGSKQSPINIVTSSTKQSHFLPLVFEDYTEEFYANVTNDGHTVKIELIGNGTRPTVQKGGLPSIYALDSIHFHWYSEHTIDGYRYPAELHAVHYDVRYNDKETAMNYENGLAVFATLFEFSVDDDRYLTPILDVIEKVGNTVGSTVQTLEPFSPSIIFPRDTSEFYRYTGSLTTPSCNEVVLWTIFSQTLYISEKQISYFNSIWSETGLLDENYRGLQDLNERKVYRKLSRPSGRILVVSGDSTRKFSFSLFSMLTIVLILLP